MLVRGLVTTLPDDLPVPPGTEGQIRTLDGDDLVATVTTDADGWWEHEMNGSPGPFRVFWDYSDVIKNQYSKLIGPSGPVDVSSIPILFRAFSDGVIDAGTANKINCAATGSSMQVGVGIGAALVRGIIYDHRFVSLVTIPPSHPTLPRVDRIVVEVVPAGAGEDIEGRSEIKVIQGTAASVAVAPALTQTESLWQIPLYRVTVNSGVTVIGSDKLTDDRTYVRAVIAADSITPTELTDDALALYAVKESGSTKNTVPINRLNFNGDDFDITVNSGFDGKQIDIELSGSAATGRAVFMPGTEFVATGPISSGTRTLATMGVGPLPTSVPYAVWLYAGVTLRNQVSSGTVSCRCNIDGGTNRTHEFQNVGGVPRWAPVIQTATVTKNPGASINATMSVQYLSGDATDVRAGQLSVIAFPATLLNG